MFPNYEARHAEQTGLGIARVRPVPNVPLAGAREACLLSSEVPGAPDSLVRWGIKLTANSARLAKAIRIRGRMVNGNSLATM